MGFQAFQAKEVALTNTRGTNSKAQSSVYRSMSSMLFSSSEGYIKSTKKSGQVGAFI